MGHPKGVERNLDAGEDRALEKHLGRPLGKRLGADLWAADELTANRMTTGFPTEADCNAAPGLGWVVATPGWLC